VTTELQDRPRPPVRLLSPKELQGILGVGETRVYEMLGRGGPLAGDVVKVGRLLRVPSDAVDRYIEASRDPR
jgi:excisionase family DNA binding protein